MPTRNGAQGPSGPTPTDTLYWREFLRNDSPDIDHPIDQAFIDKTFSKNDHFIQQLLATKPSLLLSFNDVINFLLKDSSVTAHVYCVADGGFMKWTQDNSSWFNPHLRFAVLLCPATGSPFNPGSWTICVVGSWETDSQTRFVQVASWDGIQFFFFSRDNPIQPADQQSESLIGWIYQGNSFDAFDDAKAYLGPFNGHVNGAVIMKELQDPWLHWISPRNSDIIQCCSPDVKQQLLNTAWISSNGNPFGKVETADQLQLFIQSGVDQWTSQRKQHDFSGSPSQVKIQRWMAHLLLTTTVNIQAGQFTSIAGKDAVGIPIDFFINSNSQISGNLTKGLAQPTALKDDYDSSVLALGLSLMQELDNPQPGDVTLYCGSLGGGKETGEHDTIYYMNAQSGEGNAPWTCLATSYEDTTGVLKMLTTHPGPVLLSQKFLQCVFMVDFCNPIYSWRRGVLMQYCPETTSPGTGGLYDIESNFVASIAASPNATVSGQPENDFLTWYQNYDQTTAGKMKTVIQGYLKTVNQRLKGSDSAAAVLDYAQLAESRRRIYRPVPLDEFGFSLPFAVKYPGKTDIPKLEMRVDGTVQTMPDRGSQFIDAWTGTLWTYNPQILPTFASKLGSVALASPSPAPVAAWLLPGKGKSLAVCERSSLISKKSSTSCPMMAKQGRSSLAYRVSRAVASTPAAPADAASSTLQPTWPDVLALFQAPYWPQSDSRTSVGQGWRRAMIGYGNKTAAGNEFDLWNEDCVKENVVTIYDHLRSRSMPITSDPTQYWPDDALETLRNWANQGFRTTDSDPIVPSNVIPAPVNPAPTYRTRKDIRSLTEAELNTFRAKLDNILGCQVLGSKWQELCRLHGEWCLHYQEAFSLWHRAYLRYVEGLIDFPIPYWNTLDPEVADPTCPASGLPQAFLDQTYQDPVSGQSRPNPLLYALPLDGKSTSGSNFITRDPVLAANDHSSPDFKAKLEFLLKYQIEFENTLSQTLFSYPENVTTGAGLPFGIPWANLPTFEQWMPDAPYIYSNKMFPYVPNFDGFFEQVHDNGHGWIGGTNGDMSDNAHTAADPIFLVYHANLDRVLDTYLSAHPQAQYTSTFPLRPFTDNAKNLTYDDPRDYIYTTIGDMAKDTRALGYIYAPPFADNGNDLLTAYRASHGIGGARRKLPPTKGGAPVTDLAVPQAQPKLKAFPQIVFRNIKCTRGSFTIDLFTTDASSHDPLPNGNPGFLGRITRLGMGVTDPDDPARMGPGDSRCRQTAVTRTLLLTNFKEDIIEKVAKNGFVQIVTSMADGQVVKREDWNKWDGFVGAFEVGVAPDDDQ